jgi:hypothetical protein
VRAKRIAGITPPYEQTVNGQSVCSKCGNPQALCRHHIIALGDGGADEPANLIWLCGGCHAEWHAVEHMGDDFWEWYLWPPAVVLLRLASPDEASEAMADVTDTYTFGDLRGHLGRNYIKGQTYVGLPADPRFFAYRDAEILAIEQEEKRRRHE